MKKIIYLIIPILILGFTVKSYANENNDLVIVADKNEYNNVILELDNNNNLKDIDYKTIPELNIIYFDDIDSKDDLILNNNKVIKNTEDKSSIENIETEKKKIPKGQLKKQPLEFTPIKWHLSLIQNKHKTFYTGRNVKIAVIDTGVDPDHPLYKNNLNLDKAKSFIVGDETITDDSGHGTAVAGLIAQVSPNSIITPYKVMSNDKGKALWAVDAIVQAVNDGNQIINLSFGTYSNINTTKGSNTIESFKRALQYAKDNNVMVFAASGNESIDLDENVKGGIYSVPGGNLSECSTVSSITKNKTLSSSSNYGSEVDIVAPGGDDVDINGEYDESEMMYIAYPTYLEKEYEELPSGYTLNTGTSFATPIASAIYAQYYEREQSKNSKKTPTFKKVNLEFNKALELLISSEDNRYFGNGLTILPKN